MASSERNQQEELAVLLAEREEREKYRKLDYSFPDEGPFARKYYSNHIRLFHAGKEFKERAFVAGNRTGKTFAASRELAYHATGLYPDWWEGHRFTKPISAWAVGKTNEATRDTIQHELLGPRNDEGSGAIPKELLVPSPSTRPGIPGARQDIFVKHVSGGTSVIGLKSYDQGIDAFMGTAKDFVWMDEEPPRNIYTECLTRTATTKGLMLCTFTPLNGISDTFLLYVPEMRIPEDGIVPSPDGGKSYKFVVGETWNSDLPHLPQEEKDRLKASYAPWELSARMQGIPTLGAGAVYPVAEEDVVIAPFDLPNHWPRFAGLDVGWKKTAATWLAYDQKSDVVYVYSEYYRGYAEPSVHADAIKARGGYIPIAIDPASNTPNQKDGDRLFVEYLKFGLKLMKADNSVTAGIMEVLQRLSTGRIKIFSTCQNTLAELRMYRYDENGKIVKQNDHLMDALRYAMRSSRHHAVLPYEDEEEETNPWDKRNGFDPITGY